VSCGSSLLQIYSCQNSFRTDIICVFFCVRMSRRRTRWWQLQLDASCSLMMLLGPTPNSVWPWCPAHTQGSSPPPPLQDGPFFLFWCVVAHHLILHVPNGCSCSRACKKYSSQLDEHSFVPLCDAWPGTVSLVYVSRVITCNVAMFMKRCWEILYSDISHSEYYHVSFCEILAIY
jgi:hypothetical protein